MKRGQVYYADLGRGAGSEQGGKRPCIIIQNDIGNRYSPTVIVVPMTAKNKNKIPTHVETTKDDKNLFIGSTVLTEQVQTIDKEKLGDFVCSLSEETMQKVDEALKVSLALNKEERKEETELNELQIFQNEEFGSVRTVDIDGKTYFVASDIAKSLGYAIPHKAVQTHCKGVLKWNIPTSSGNQDMLVIPEGDIYRLIIKSQLPSADKFERWIFDEVIPQIRQTGSYGVPKTATEQIRLLAQGNVEINQRIGTVEDRVKELEQTTTLDHGQQRVLENTVNKTVINILGGKESNAYKKVGRKVFAECNRDLKNYFKVNSRDDVPKLHYGDALKYAESWRPCTNTLMMIEDCNAQLNIGHHTE